ncbi:MAG: hypothetical protein ACK5JL_04740 [Candidatus Kapaibacterium sp.]
MEDTRFGLFALVDSTITSALSKSSSLISRIEILGAHHAVA